jgi:CHASE2 domain-containing sensor protein
MNFTENLQAHWPFFLIAIMATILFGAVLAWDWKPKRHESAVFAAAALAVVAFASFGVTVIAEQPAPVTATDR